MAGTFSFELDGKRALVRATLGGFFEIEDVRRYEQEWIRALTLLGYRPNRHLTLCDVSGCQLSKPEVVAELQRVIGEPRYRSRRCAMVVPGALARIQARRVVQRDDIAMFDTLVEAEIWLLRPDPSDAPASVENSVPVHGNPLATLPMIG